MFGCREKSKRKIDVTELNVWNKNLNLTRLSPKTTKKMFTRFSFSPFSTIFYETENRDFKFSDTDSDKLKPIHSPQNFAETFRSTVEGAKYLLAAQPNSSKIVKALSFDEESFKERRKERRPCKTKLRSWNPRNLEKLVKSNEAAKGESDKGCLEPEKVRRENERKSEACCEAEAAFFGFFFPFFFLTLPHSSQNKRKLDFLNLNFVIKLDLLFYLFLWRLNFGVLVPTKFKPTFLTV